MLFPDGCFPCLSFENTASWEGKRNVYKYALKKCLPNFCGILNKAVCLLCQSERERRKKEEGNRRAGWAWAGGSHSPWHSPGLLPAVVILRLWLFTCVNLPTLFWLGSRETFVPGTHYQKKMEWVPCLSVQLPFSSSYSLDTSWDMPFLNSNNSNKSEGLFSPWYKGQDAWGWDGGLWGVSVFASPTAWT